MLKQLENFIKTEIPPPLLTLNSVQTNSQPVNSEDNIAPNPSRAQHGEHLKEIPKTLSNKLKPA